MLIGICVHIAKASLACTLPFRCHPQPQSVHRGRRLLPTVPDGRVCGEYIAVRKSRSDDADLRIPPRLQDTCSGEIRSFLSLHRLSCFSGKISNPPDRPLTFLVRTTIRDFSTYSSMAEDRLGNPPRRVSDASLASSIDNRGSCLSFSQGPDLLLHNPSIEPSGYDHISSDQSDWVHLFSASLVHQFR